jgi:putative OPT family oligopeptide transporter
VKPEPRAYDTADSTRAAANVASKLPVAANDNKLARENHAASDPPELTFRALGAGVALGAVLAAANVYTALKTGYIDGGSITASVLGFALFRVLGRAYSKLENNITQTVAGSAAVMSFVAGVAGPTAALERAGMPLSSTQLITWSLALGVLGVAIGAGLRSRLIAAEGLPFPTGTATAEVIAAMAQASEHALRRARGLLLGAAAAAAIACVRDSFGLLPQMIALPFGIAGLTAAELSLGVSVSPLLFATGLISGLRAGASMLLGGMLAWLVILPRLIAAGIVQGSDHGAAAGWLLWPAVALVLSSSLTALALDWRTLASGVRDVWNLLRRRAPPSAAPATSPTSPRGLFVLIALSIGAVIWVCHTALDLSPIKVLLALLLSAALCVVCARGAGETDIAPVGDMGGLTQLFFSSPVTKASSLACGGIATAKATQTAQMLWAFKAGHKLGASPRRQVVAQLLGVVVGALVVVPTYAVIARAYGIGSERLPSISVMSWEATAAAVQGGLSTLPRYAAAAAGCAFALGALLTVLGKRSASPYLPSPVALGIGVLMPLSMTAALFIGSVCVAFLQARKPAWTAENLESIAGGVIAGESLFAVIMAALIAFGVITG